MKEFDLTHLSEIPDEIEGVSRIKEDDTSDISKKSKLPSLEQLTTISFVVICVIISAMAIRFISHFHIMNEYAIPEDAVISENDQVQEEDVTYVDEVVYNPSSLGKAMAKAQNTYISDDADLMGEPLWYNGTCNYKWRFMSGYDYRSAKIDCIWICKDEDTGNVLAFHTATYDGGTNEFKDGITKLTEEGVNNIAVD